MTSYKSAEMAKSLGHGNVRVYDDGIFEWVKVYPQETVLFDHQVTREVLAQYVINEEEFGKGPWIVDDRRFVGMAKSGDYEIVDIRGPMERRERPITLPNVIQVTFDQLINRFKQGDFSKSRVLIVDNLCNQAIWAKCYLDRHGIKHCFFLRGELRPWRAEAPVGIGDKLGLAVGRPASK